MFKHEVHPSKKLSHLLIPPTQGEKLMSEIIQGLIDDGTLREIDPWTSGYLDHLNSELSSSGLLPDDIRLTHYICPKEKKVMLTYDTDLASEETAEKFTELFPTFVQEYNGRISAYKAK